MDPDGPWSNFEPLAVTPIAKPPTGHIDPDPTKGWWRRVWPLLAARRFAFVGSLVAAVVALVCGVLLPRITMQAIDVALVGKRAPLSHYLWFLAALGATRSLLTYGYRTVLYSMAYDLEYDLRTIIYGHLTRLDFQFFDRVQAGQLISRANSDIRSVQMFCTFAPLMALNVVSFLVALCLMLVINVKLTVVALIVMPFTYLTGVRLRNLMFPLSWIIQARAAEISTIVDENVQGVRVIKGFAAEQRQLHTLARTAQRLRWSNVAQADARARWGPLVENLPRLGLAAVLLYGGKLAIDGTVSVGALVAFNAYVVLLQAPFRFLSTILILGQRAKASAERIFEVVDEAPRVVDHPGAVDLVEARGTVSFDNVRFAYGHGEGPAVLDGFSMTVAPGETVAVVGATGSGKSTIARLLARFYDVDDGTVAIDGHDVRTLTLGSVRHHVGIVTDEPFLFSDTVRANIAFARPDASDDDVRAAAVAAQADGFIEELAGGYDAIVGERGYDLSGGQRQRIAIARVLLAAPAIVVLDDATSAIDVAVEERIHAALHAMLAGRTVIVIAHRLSTIATADRVVLLEDGRVIAEGTHESLLATEARYGELLARVTAGEAGAPANALDGSIATAAGGD